MAKGQQRSNREKKKPKADKRPQAQTSPFPPAPGMAKLKGGAGKKAR